MLSQNILKKPTFDLTDFEITKFDENNQMIFCKSKHIFQFDKCKGTVTNRSRVLRPECRESIYIESVNGAVIDANFTGKLCFKIKMTKEGIALFLTCIRAGDLADQLSQDTKLSDFFTGGFQTQIQDSVQIDLTPCQNNYYDKDNSNFQEGLTPDVKFFCENETTKAFFDKVTGKELAAIVNAFPDLETEPKSN